MKDWKQAIWIASFELKRSWRGVLSLLTIFIFYTYLILAMPFWVDKPGSGVSDVLFILLFTFVPSWCKPKSFQFQMINGSFQASPSMVMLTQLPIREKTIIRSRMIVHFLFSFPIQFVSLLTMYLISSRFSWFNISPFTYLLFMVTWLSFGVYVGLGINSIEVGRMAKDKNKIHTLIGICFLIVVAVSIVSFPLLFPYSIVGGSMILIEQYPLIVTMTSIFLAILGINYWQKKMEKSLKRMDYY
ncbi:hypothetical protein SAMN05216389_11334 [Oceanobacillus limi]|uniref:ABC-2 type transport system permease protein n=1 Tax=Oceanobacillus limi TaxID=930131 RepID=A0A1I0EZS8_9BACI|nr:hypothetical protein [Oceanobacillus limi]SET50871.1 hypothetical protein SAMN05216389_11334 [Oceanobacillus limi]